MSDSLDSNEQSENAWRVWEKWQRVHTEWRHLWKAPQTRCWTNKLVFNQQQILKALIVNIEHPDEYQQADILKKQHISVF